MNITIHLGSWMFPAIITLIGLIAISLTAFAERNDSGLMSGLGTVFCFLICLPASGVAWLIWALMKFFT